MTVCVAIKVHDCIVFAADSASSLVSPGPNGGSFVSNIWQHGIKVFNLHRELPVVAMTAGMGHIGPASISNLAKDLRLELTADGANGLDKNAYTIEYVAERARTFFAAKYAAIDPVPANPHAFEFWIGGYGANGARGEIWKFNIQDGTVHPIEQLARAEDADRLVWGGQSKPIGRLIHSLDNEMTAALAQRNVSAEDLIAARQQVETPLVHSTMPVQDAIDLADFLVDVTKKYFAFLPGANVVGGDTEIATVTKHEGFKWIKRKHYYPEHLNRRDTDHVTRQQGGAGNINNGDP